MDNSGDFSRLVLEYGIGFIIFYVFLVAIFFAGVVKLIQTFKRSGDLERKRILLLFIAMAFPWLVVIIRSMGLTGGYEISFMGIIFGTVFAMLSLIKYGYFDSVQAAVSNVIYKSSEGLLVLDNSKNVLYYNSIVKHIFPEIAVNKPVDREVTEKCFYDNGCINELSTQNTIESNCRIYELKAEPIYEAEYIQGYMVRIFDYTSHYRSMEELRRSVHIDALTGLYDRELFKQEIIRHLSDGGTGALVMSDIDFFKQINDNFGHMIGDEALVTLAEAIRSVFSGHLYCRVGGDEFMMFVKDTNDTDIIGEFAERLNAVFREKVKNVSEGLDSSLSMGIALSSSISDGTESDEVFEMLYGLADTALYNTKNNGKNGFSFYETMPAR